jgi:two-component system, NtrC family, sensor kinase
MIIIQPKFTLLGISAVLFIAAFVWDAHYSGDVNLRRYKASIESYLHATEKRADIVISDEGFIRRRLLGSQLGSIYEQDLKKTEVLRTEVFNFCIFKDDSLVFWSRNDVLPLWSDFSDTVRNKTITKYVTLRESNYELRYHNYLNKVIIATLIPLKHSYPALEGEYLENHFPASWTIPSELNLVETKGTLPIVTTDNNILCYLDNNETYADLMHDIGVFLLLLIGFFLLGIFVDNLAKQMLTQYESPLPGVLFFLSCLTFMLFCIKWIPKSKLLPLWDLGMSNFYNAIFVKSLAELMINTAFLFWFAIFFNFEFKLQDYSSQPLWKRLSLGAAFYSIIVLLIVLCIGIVNDLVTHWNHLLAFDNLSDFNIHSITALLSIGIILLSIFLVSHRLISTLNELLVNNFEHFIAVDVAVGIGILLFENYPLSLPTWMYVIFIFVYIGLFHQFIRYKRPGLIWLIQWIIIFSAIIAFFISRFNVQKDRKTLENFSYTLANEQDIIAEKRINFLTRSIEKDLTIQTLSISPIRFNIDSGRIAERISLKFNSEEYLSNHYSFSYVSHFQNGETLTQSDSITLLSLMQKRETGKILDTSNQVGFWSDKKGQFAYLAVAKVPVITNNPFFVEMEFKREDKLSSRVFTELFTDKNYKGLPRLNDYSYAIYKNGECKEQNQTGLYSHYLDKKDLPGENSYKYFSDHNRDELIYQSSDGVVVKIRKERTISSRGIALGMYIVLVLVFLILILSVINHYIRFLPDIVKFSISFSLNATLRNRILFPSITFILVSYVVIFFFSVRYFKNIDERYYNNDLENKSDYIVTNAVIDIKEMHDYNIDTSSNINKMLMRYSERYQTALHIFDTQGHLVATTENNIFDKDKGMISKRMNPLAFMHLKSGEKIFKSEEQIGKFHYRSAYYVVEDVQGRQLAFLELPFYSRDRKQKVGVSEIWTYNATILTMLMVLGICIIYIRTSKNIEPLQQIADKLSRLSLGNKEKNEPILWNKKDEIGVLIDAYNNKVDELEGTYARLEDAQREIAESEKLAALGELMSGIAHEIQNPLNFVNNFSELSLEQTERLKEEIDKPDSKKEVVNHLLNTLSQNQERINRHGKRASSIVKGMLEHARISSGKKELTDINTLTDEYLRLSYHSLKAKDKTFNVKIITEFQSNLLEIEVIPQEIGRVLLNLLNNAFYSVTQKNNKGISDYKPVVTISTKLLDHAIEIKILDNGDGMTEITKSKIFHPLFTTKPRGQGTGLGLSLSHDIITKVHGGSLKVETKEGEFAEFIIHLPFNKHTDIS